jgi:hypothetical protein
MTRRTLLAAAAAALANPVGFRTWGGEPAEPVVRDEDPRVLSELNGVLRNSFVEPLESTKTSHYLCIGNVPVAHRLRVARHCEAILSEAMTVYARAGFEAKRPESRLTVVVLKDRTTFERLAADRGADPQSNGFYSIKRRTAFCYLATLDQQPDRLDWDATLRRIGHEAMHQVGYNSGLLNPLGDVPDCIGEGLAMLAEDSTRESPRMLRHSNTIRLKRLGEARTGVPISLETFFATDDAFTSKDDRGRVYDAYSLAWLLVDTLIADAALRPRFGAYLKAIAARPRDDRSHRVEDARIHLGDLQDLGGRISRRLRYLLDHPPSRYNSPRRS